MFSIDVIAAGRMRDQALLALWGDYVKRLQWPLTLHEIDTAKPADIERRMLEKLLPGARIFVLDERGKSLRSADFAAKIRGCADEGVRHVQFVIGAADGLGADIRARADFLLSFGAQTWPHMLARVMLAEQLYRARQILAGHPYHRE
jgi:23S rRNA (pseudouridine1915-N3)-methyltransferase